MMTSSLVVTSTLPKNPSRIIPVVLLFPKFSRDRHILRGSYRRIYREEQLSKLINPSLNSRTWCSKCCRISSLSWRNCSWTRHKGERTKSCSCFRSDLGHCCQKETHLLSKTFSRQVLGRLLLTTTRPR
jgi:hypothetical protein